MKKQGKNHPIPPAFDNTEVPCTSWFINASGQRFISPLVLNFLCLKRAPGKIIDRLGETYSQRERLHGDSNTSTITAYATHPAMTADNASLSEEDDDDIGINKDDPDYQDIGKLSAANKAPVTGKNAIIDAIFTFLNIATDGRITKASAYENDGRTIRKQYARDMILLLGTLRIKANDNNAFCADLLELTTTLEQCVRDMTCLFHVKECPQSDHKSCQISLQTTTFSDNGATLDTMIRRCVVMVATLQRKALNIANRLKRIKHETEKRLGQKPDDITNQRRPPDTNDSPLDSTNEIFAARDVVNALKDAYQREEELSEQLAQTRAQFEHISTMIDTTRQAMVKMSSLLLSLYRTAFLRTNKTQNILIHVPGIPTVLRDTFAIETFCADTLQTIEVIRQLSINTDKLIENRYDNAIKYAIWPTCRSVASHAVKTGGASASLAYRDTTYSAFSQKYNAIARLHEDMLNSTTPNTANTASGNDRHGQQAHDDTHGKQNDNEDKQHRYMTHLSETYASFLQVIKQTRRNVNTHAYHCAPHDIRAMAFAFFTILGERLCADDTINLTTIPLETGHQRHGAAQHLPPPATLPTNPDELAMDEINAAENAHLINTSLSYSISPLPYMVKRHLTLRAIGDMAVCLRNEQNIFQLDYLINAINHQMDNLYAARQEEKNAPKTPNEKTAAHQQHTINRMMDECIVSGLHRINNANFDLSASLWKHVETWHYASVDHFRFTYLAANLSNLQNSSELKNLQELVALYAYLLSYKLEQILFVPKQEEDHHHDDDDSQNPRLTHQHDQGNAQPPTWQALNENDSSSSDISMAEPAAPGHEKIPLSSNNKPALKRKHPACCSDEPSEEGEPWRKRRGLHEDSRFHHNDEMPMIIGEDGYDNDTLPPVEDTIKNQRAGSKGLPVTSKDTYLHKPKYRLRKTKHYSKIYHSKKQDALRMFYRNEAITNLDDILQGVRFEKRQKANNVASYERTLRRLNAHLMTLQKKKNHY